MRVYEAIAQAVAEEDVKAVFAVLGDANMKWLSTLEQRGGIPVYYARHEGSAIVMADGYARSTGQVGLCSVTSGPGLTLTATGLVAASRNRSPVLVIAGDSPRSNKHYQQSIDQARFARASETWPIDLRSAPTLTEDLREAFYLTRTAGPVVFNAPFDVQNEPVGEDWRYEPSSSSIGEPQTQTPDSRAIAEAADLLRESARPIILAGRGAVHAVDELRRLADATGALLSTTLLAKGLFDDDPRNLGVAGGLSNFEAKARFAEADCILAAGASLNQFTTDKGSLFPNARVIHITLEEDALIGGRRQAWGRPGGTARADVLVRSDSREAAAAILKEHGDRSVPPWAEVEGPEPVPSQPTEDGRMHPAAAAVAIREAADPRSRFVIGVGHAWWFPINYLRGWPPDRYTFVTDFAAIGQTLPAGIGVAVGNPDDKTVVIEGDGSAMMTIQEIDTAVRYGLDLTIVVLNDDGLGAEAHKLKALGFDDNSARIPSPDLAAVARAFGAFGETVTEPEQLEDAIVEAQARGGGASSTPGSHRP